jgi:hypothetical protein
MASNMPPLLILILDKNPKLITAGILGKKAICSQLKVG